MVAGREMRSWPLSSRQATGSTRCGKRGHRAQGAATQPEVPLVRERQTGPTPSTPQCVVRFHATEREGDLAWGRVMEDLQRGATAGRGFNGSRGRWPREPVEP